MTGSDLEVRTHPAVVRALGRHLAPDEVEDLVASLAPSTWRAYRPAWSRWLTWSTGAGEDVMPPTGEAVSAWIGWLLDDQLLALPTVRKHAAALASLVDLAVAFGSVPPDVIRPTEHPRVRRRLAGRARTTQHQPLQKDALSTSDIVEMAALLAGGGRPHQLRRLRDRALLLVAFAGGFRRSELSALHVQDLTFRGDGYLEIRIRRSKLDQMGRGRVVGLAPGSSEMTCPVRTLRRWLDSAAVLDGAVFRPIISRAGGLREFVQPPALGPRSVAEIIKTCASLVGHDPTSIGGHSTRRGHVTAAIDAGATDGQIAATTGQSRGTIDGYTAARQVRANSSRMLGL
jgi:integrase